MKILTLITNSLMMTMSVVSYEFERLVAFVIIILVDRVILDTTCLI